MNCVPVSKAFFDQSSEKGYQTRNTTDRELLEFDGINPDEVEGVVYGYATCGECSHYY